MKKINENISVKKIVSLNPKKYKFIFLDRAIAEYYEWICSYYETHDNKKRPKTFYKWLNTEI